jgi:hypothetical protein
MEYTALSFWQPYAWLIVNGYAEVDSRHWSPPAKFLGQRIAVHASQKKVTKSGYEEFALMVKDLKIKNFPKSPSDFDYGSIVGTVEIEKVVRDSNSYWAAPGYFHWILRSPKRIEPLPMKGKMGWFTVRLDGAQW